MIDHSSSLCLSPSIHPFLRGQFLLCRQPTLFIPLLLLPPIVSPSDGPPDVAAGGNDFAWDGGGTAGGRFYERRLRAAVPLARSAMHNEATDRRASEQDGAAETRERIKQGLDEIPSRVIVMESTDDGGCYGNL